MQCRTVLKCLLLDGSDGTGYIVVAGDGHGDIKDLRFALIVKHTEAVTAVFGIVAVHLDLNQAATFELFRQHCSAGRNCKGAALSGT